MLPLQLWGATSLSKIGSALGTPLVTDECTNHKLRVSYVRIWVEVDITKKFPSEITIKDSQGMKRKQVIEYEWRPKYYDKCKQVGHQCGEQPKAKVLKPKMKKPEEPKPAQTVLSTPKENPIEKPEVDKEKD